MPQEYDPVEVDFERHGEIWGIWVDDDDIEIFVKNKFGVIINIKDKKVHVTNLSDTKPTQSTSLEERVAKLEQFVHVNFKGAPIHPAARPDDGWKKTREMCS